MTEFFVDGERRLRPFFHRMEKSAWEHRNSRKHVWRQAEPHCHSFKELGPCLSQRDRLHPPPHAPTCRSVTDPYPCSAAASAENPCCVEIVHRGSPFGANVCHWDGFSGMASEERRCFGVPAAERSVDAALVVPEEANPLTPNQHPNQFHCKP